MKYVIEDTHTGYRLSMLDSRSGAVRHKFDETGGHGPVERLYADASRLWLDLRAGELTPNQDQCEGHPAGPGDLMGQTVYCDGALLDWRVRRDGV